MSNYEININPSEVDPDGTRYRGKFKKLNSSAGASGSAEIPTCTVKFVFSDNAYSNDYIAYTKHEGGVTSIVSINSDTPEENRGEYTFENVVCDSIIYFNWYYDTECGDILIDGGVEQITNSVNGPGETNLFKAQSEPNTVSTITLEGYDPLPEW